METIDGLEDLCIFISNVIKQGVKVVKNDHPDIIWIKLKKDFSTYPKIYLYVLHTLAHLIQTITRTIILQVMICLNT